MDFESTIDYTVSFSLLYFPYEESYYKNLDARSCDLIDNLRYMIYKNE